MRTKESLILIFSIVDLILSLGLNVVDIGLSGIVMIAVFVAYILVWVLVAKDIKEKGISWAFMVLPILLGGIGGIAYVIINREKPSNSQITPNQAR